MKPVHWINPGKFFIPLFLLYSYESFWSVESERKSNNFKIKCWLQSKKSLQSLPPTGSSLKG